MGTLKKAWLQRCIHEGDWYLTPVQRVWLTLKFTLCLLLKLEATVQPGYNNHVCVAILGSSSWLCEFGTCTAWDEIRVGKGFLKNWWYFEDTDGAP